MKKSLKRFMLLVQLSLKELKNHYKLSLFFIFNLSLGLLSFLLIDSFKESLELHFAAKNRELLGADLRLSSRKKLPQEEYQRLLQEYGADHLATKISYFSMGRNESLSRLVQVNVINEVFPLYGSFLLADFSGRAVPLEEAFKRAAAAKQERWLVVSPEVRNLFSLTEGEPFSIGDETYRVAYVFTKDVSGGTFGMSAIAPKTYVLAPRSAEARYRTLERKGNTTRYYYYLKVPTSNAAFSTSSETAAGQSAFLGAAKTQSRKVAQQAEAIRLRLEQRLTNLGAAEALSLAEQDEAVSRVSVRTYENSGSQVETSLRYVNRYLSLVSLVALFLSGIGVAYLFRTFTEKKLSGLAIMQSLGMKRKDTFLLSLLELLFLSLIAASLTAAAAFFLIPFVPRLFANFLPEGFLMNFQVKSMLTTFALSALGTVVFCLPALLSSRRVNLLILFQEQARRNMLSGKLELIGLVPSLTFFYLLSIWLAESFFIGSVFTLLFIGSLLVIISLGGVLLGFLRRLLVRQRGARWPLLLSLSLKSLARNPLPSLFYFTALSLSTLLICVIPQIERGLHEEITSPEKETLPDLFLFNIVKEDLEELKKVSKSAGVSLEEITPMLSANLTHKNGVPISESIGGAAENSLEERRRNRFRRRVNLSYRSELSSSETIVKGRPLKKTHSFGEVVEISLEEDYAEDMNYKIGDELTFRLVEVPLVFETRVVNYRLVKWNSFKPNFFIMFQPGVLEEVPQTYLAAARLNEQSAFSPEEAVVQKNAFQKQAGARLPNISFLDVSGLIKEALKIIRQISLLIQVMAFFSLGLGLFILFAIALYQMQQKEQELNLLKVLGGSLSRVMWLTLFEYALMGAAALLTGVGLSLLFTYGTSLVFFDGVWSLSLGLLLGLFVLLFILILAITYLASQRVLKQKPILLLKEAL